MGASLTTGADQVTVAAVSPDVAMTPVGAPGGRATARVGLPAQVEG